MPKVKISENIYALVDCNSFFCSCEQLFRPDLIGRPVGVLSSNDGCFVSRTKELKALGVKMGAPYFLVKELCERENVQVFSSNFALYTNISDRVMCLLSSFSPEMEVYSVDEAFLNLTGLDKWDLNSYGQEIKEAVFQYTGIPVCVGIGTTKTLAKLANHIAKESEKSKGVVVLLDEKLQRIALERVDVSQVWGIGKKMALKCQYLGIKTALDFRNYPNEKLLQKTFTKVGRQVQDELRGISCHELETVTKQKKEITTSRTFGQSVFDLKVLREAVANHISVASEKMRKQKSVCSMVEVFCKTNIFKDSEQYYGKKSFKFLCSTGDTRSIIKYAWSVLDDLYKAGFEYKKSGIKLTNLSSKNEFQLSLLEEHDDEKSVELMKVIDQINRREGRNTIRSLACGLDNKNYKMRQSMKSPRYLQGWSELRKVK